MTEPTENDGPVLDAEYKRAYHDGGHFLDAYGSHIRGLKAVAALAIRETQSASGCFYPSGCDAESRCKEIGQCRYKAARSASEATCAYCGERRLVNTPDSNAALQERFKENLAESEADLKAKLKPYEDGERASNGGISSTRSEK